MNDEEKLNNCLNKKDIPEVIITEPEIIKHYNWYDWWYDTYDYSKSHIIYRDYDLGSLEELKSMKEENEKLKKQYCERVDCAARLGESKKVKELQASVKYYVDILTDLKKWLEEKVNNEVNEKHVSIFKAAAYEHTLEIIKELEDKYNV